MSIALPGSAGELEWREAMTRAGLDLWIGKEGQVGGAPRSEGLETLGIMADGVSCHEALRIAQERGTPALCVNCEGAALCRTMPDVRDNACCLW